MTDLFVSDPQKTAPNNATVPDSAIPSVPTQVPSTESQRAAIPGHSHNHLSSFRLYPEDVKFETQEADEKIIILIRAHPITNVGWILLAILMFFIPGIARSIGVFNSLPGGFDLVITLVWYLITMVYILESFLGWYFNVYFVTNLRVIDVDFYNLVYKQVSDANIDKIQDVSYNMGGVLRTVFNYGNVFIQTAAKVQEFDFLAIPNPDKVAKIIEDMITKDEQNEQLGENEQL
jgi:membrane protein YdbS with pleckstrin-like domain